MFYYLPVKIYEEENCVCNHKADIAALGKKALIVTGKTSAKKNGSYNDVKSALEDMKVSYVLFDLVEENPSVETVMSASELGKKENVDFVIGIGGGSAMDAAKAIAIMLANKDKNADFLYDKSSITTALPLVEIPTTCGTGSEATAVSILTNHATKSKGSIPHKLFADLSLVDARYLMSAPKSVINNTAIDALGHLIESYLNSKATDYSKIFVKSGLEMWSRTKTVIIGEKEAEYEDYRNLINASTLGGMAIAHTGTSLPHALSYRLTYDLSMPHGAAVGYFLASFIREADKTDADYLLGLAGFSSVDELQSFYEQTCSFDEVKKEILDKTFNDVLNNPAKLATSSFKTDEAVLKRIVNI